MSANEGAHAGNGLPLGPREDETREPKTTTGELRIGRHPDNHLELPFIGVSASHARLFQKGPNGEWWLEDLGSSNGTWLDDRRLQPGHAERVKIGDRFRVGAVSIQIDGSRGKLEGGESTATIGRRLLSGGLVSAPAELRPASIQVNSAETGFAQRHETQTRVANDERQRAPSAPARARNLSSSGAAPSSALRRPPPTLGMTKAKKAAVMAFAIGMTALAISGLVALALSLR